MPWGWVILGSVALVVAGEVILRVWVFRRALKLQEKALDAFRQEYRESLWPQPGQQDPFDRP